MAGPCLPEEALDEFATAYREAIAAGHLPRGATVGTGRRAAATVASETLGLTSNQQRGRLAALDMRRPGWSATRRDAHLGLVGAPPIPPAAVPPDGMAIHRNSGAYDENGKLLRQWIGTKRDSGEPFALAPGHVVKGESVLLDAEGRVQQRWLKTREGDGAGLVEALQEAFASYKGAAPAIAAPSVSDDDLMTVYPLPDLHLGLYAWAPETGADYDTDIAVAIATQAVETLVEQSRPSGRAVLLGLGDYFHANDEKAATPGSGHRLDVDGRWPKVLAAGARLAVGLIEAVARKHKQVEVKFLRGNHDTDAAVAITVALGLFYDRNPRITINDDPAAIWYRRFGSCLLGATHGHTMKPERMAMAMATDCASDWGETMHRHFMFGHIHTETVREVGPVRCESFSSPAARDAWNAESGYRSGRALNAITYHRDRGEVGRHRVSIGSQRRSAA